VAKSTSRLRIYFTLDLERLRVRDQQITISFTILESNFAVCKGTFQSTSGYMILMNGGVVAYYSGRQMTVALCTAMAETTALAKLSDTVGDKL
jgi:hypothetical protein